MSVGERNQSMQWLHCQHHWAGFTGPDFFACSPAGREAVVAFLERACTAMRRRAISVDWSYSPTLHAEHHRILTAEKAALERTARQPLAA